MRSGLRVAAIAAVLASGAAGAMAADTLTCPERLAGGPSVAAPSGWEARPGTQGGAFAGVTLFDGDPKELASLVPDSDDGKRAAWTFDRGRAYWLQCGYGPNGPVLERRLAAGTAACEVAYVGRGRSVRTGRTVTCR